MCRRLSWSWWGLGGKCRRASGISRVWGSHNGMYTQKCGEHKQPLVDSTKTNTNLDGQIFSFGTDQYPRNG